MVGSFFLYFKDFIPQVDDWCVNDSLCQNFRIARKYQKQVWEFLEGYKNYLEGHIIDAKECFEKAIKYNPQKPEGYVLLAQTLQLMSGYDNSSLKYDAEENYKKALAIYESENLLDKVDDMKRQIRHLNSTLSFK